MASKFLLGKYCSDCGEQCSTTEFVPKLSFLTAALDWQMDGIKEFVEQSNMSLPKNWSTTWPKHIEASYLSLKVLQETSLVENYTQIATLNLVDIVSIIGGQTGLWIGISFLSMVELIEMIYRLLRYGFYVVRRKRRIKP